MLAGRLELFPLLILFHPAIWKDMYAFSSDSVLLCLASEHYDAEEYIRDYNTYIRIIRDREALIGNP